MIKDAPGFVTRHLHGHTLGDSRSNHVPDGRSPKIVEYLPRPFETSALAFGAEKIFPSDFLGELHLVAADLASIDCSVSDLHECGLP